MSRAPSAGRAGTRGQSSGAVMAEVDAGLGAATAAPEADSWPQEIEGRFDEAAAARESRRQQRSCSVLDRLDAPVQKFVGRNGAVPAFETSGAAAVSLLPE